MKVNVKKLLAVLCGVVMLFNSGMGIVAHAQEVPEEDVELLIASEYEELTGDNVGHGIYDIPGDGGGAKAAMMTDCTIGISIWSDGVKASISTGSTVPSTEMGILDIRLEKYVNGDWVWIGRHPGGSVNNTNAMGMNVSSPTAEKGVYYRLSCTHYALINGIRRKLKNVTNGIKY